MKDNDETLDPVLARAGAKIAALKREDPPKNLVSRTLDRISRECKPVKKVFWMLRPITHPLARVGAAALIIFSLMPMTDLNLAAPLGTKIEERILGHRAAEKIEHMVDSLLVRYGDANFTDCDPDVFTGAQRPSTPPRRAHATHSPRV